MLNTFNIHNCCNVEVRLEHPTDIIICYSGNDIIYFQFAEKGTNMISASFNIVKSLCPCKISFNVPFKRIIVRELKKQLVKDIILPEPEHSYGFGDFRIEVSNHTSRASIVPAQRKIYICDNFYNFPHPVRSFILAHELGHMHYRTEEFCDLYALRHCLSVGHNYSNMLYAQTKILSQNRENYNRQLALFAELKRQQGQY